MAQGARRLSDKKPSFFLRKALELLAAMKLDKVGRAVQVRLWLSWAPVRQALGRDAGGLLPNCLPSSTDVRVPGEEKMACHERLKK